MKCKKGHEMRGELWNTEKGTDSGWYCPECDSYLSKRDVPAKKVGHFWNICGIGGLLARYLDDYYPGQYESVAIDRGHADIFGHNNEKSLVWRNRAMVWLARCFWYARKLDIIHVHSGIKWLMYYRMFYPGKKLIIHLHGTKIRGRWSQEPEVFLADGILVSTPDLLEGAPDGTMYLPNPVDEEMIARVNCELRLEGDALMAGAFHVDRFAPDIAVEYAEAQGLELQIHDRSVAPLQHYEFLKLLGKHEYYIDVKRDFPGYISESKVLEALSMTGLEALALGCLVIDWKGEIQEGLPQEQSGKMIAGKLHCFYEGLK